jgi:hypothetical protein
VSSLQPFTGWSLRECSLDTKGKKEEHLLYKTTNAINEEGDSTSRQRERGEIHRAALLGSIDVATYCVAWNAMEHVIGHQ